MKAMRSLLKARELPVFLALVLVVGLTGVANPTFLSATGARDILLGVAIVAILAIGQTFVIVMRHIDLSVGSLVGFASFRANPPRTSCAGGILRLWALYEHVLRRLLRPHSREGESARGFEASSALTGCFLLRAVFVEAVKNEEDWRTRDEVRYSNLPPGGVIEGATVS